MLAASGLAARGDWTWLAVILGVPLLLLAGAWLLAPYHRGAWNLIAPDLSTFDRRAARAERAAGVLQRLPIVGMMFRVGTQQTEQLLQDQRAIVAADEQTDGKPG